MSSSQANATPVPKKRPWNKTPDRFVYRGPSMAPTFRSGQILYIISEIHDITPGDVIVFHDPKRDGTVVHRIISVTPDGFITRGDNNLYNDATAVLPTKVIGKVEKSNFQGKIRPVIGGWRGLFRARILWMTLMVRRFLRRGLSRPYQWLKRSGIAAKIWHPQIEMIHLETPDGPLVKYVHKGKTVASHWAQNNRWHCRHPYDLVISLKSTVRQKHGG